jgi:hypothetical protein
MEYCLAKLTLVHLSAQRDVVAKYVEGWSIDEILTWMREYGTVIEPNDENTHKSYIFQSHAGFKDAFYFTDEGVLVIFNTGWIT